MKNKVDEERLKEILRSPVKWGERYLWNRDGSRRTYWDHQIEDLLCSERNICHLDGRDVGKSISLSTDALHYCFITRGGLGLIGAPQQGHLDSIIEEIEYQLSMNKELEKSVVKIRRKPYFKIDFANGSSLYFRPAGPYGDAFRSLHVERVWVDEGAWLTEKAWVALRQCLKEGGRMKVYSTPNGLRNTTYYRLTLNPKWKVFRWPSWISPTWTEDRESELLDFYGGRDTPGYQHEVAGEHGKPAYGAFQVEAFNAAKAEVPEYRRIDITGEELRDCNSESEIFDRLEMLLNLCPQQGVFYMGGDTGYTQDPTELVIFKEEVTGEKRVLKMVLRAHLEHVGYPYIAQTIALLDRFYSFAAAGIDNGGNGLAVVQELLTMDKYKGLQLEGRLRGYDFGGVTTLSVDRDGKEVRKRTKELMTSLINGALQRRQLVFPDSDSEIEDQFLTHTYTLQNGYVVYSKGNDHIIDAVRCAMLAQEQGRLDGCREETAFVVPSLTDAVFI